MILDEEDPMAVSMGRRDAILPLPARGNTEPCQGSAQQFLFRMVHVQPTRQKKTYTPKGLEARHIAISPYRCVGVDVAARCVYASPESGPGNLELLNLPEIWHWKTCADW